MVFGDDGGEAGRILVHSASFWNVVIPASTSTGLPMLSGLEKVNQ
jgi:hypothetical protein